MVWLARIIALTCVLSTITGCNRRTQQPAVESIKVGDLAPTGAGRQQGRVLHAISIEVTVFELAGEQMGSLDRVWALLDANQVRPVNAGAFAQNGFRIGSGGYASLQKVITILREAQGIGGGQTLLLIPDGQAELLDVARVPAKTIISYATAGQREHRQLGPGALALRIVAGKLAGSQGVCSIQAAPVFTIPTAGLSPQLAERLKAGEFRFTSAGFTARVRPGDFLLLAPAAYPQDRDTLGGLFFSSPAARPVIRLFCLLCSGIT